MNTLIDRAPFLRPAGRWLKRQIVPGCVALMYHRVADEAQDPWRLCVGPRHFAQQMEVLRAAGVRVIHARDLADSLTKGAVPRRSVVITFDDGYLDNLEQARPILEKFEMPATLFVASGYIGSTGEFWWDALERIFLEPGNLPDELRIDIDGEERSWHLGPATSWSTDEAASFHNWVPSSPPQCLRHKLYQEFRNSLLGMTAQDRESRLAALLDWADLPATARPKRRILDAEGLRRMAGDGLVDIGGHSVSHPDLTKLSGAAQEQELRNGKSALEVMLGRSVVGFAYPHGANAENTRRLVRDLGYSYAFGTSRHTINRRSDLFKLARVGVPNVPGDVFKAQLAALLPLSK